MEGNEIPYFSKNYIFQCTNYTLPSSLGNGDTITNPYNIANTFNNDFTSTAETAKKALNIHIKIFQTILRMKMAVEYFCNLLIKKK